MADTPYNPPPQPGSDPNLIPLLQGIKEGIDLLNSKIRSDAGVTGYSGAFKTVRDEEELQGQGGEIQNLEHMNQMGRMEVVVSARMQKILEANSEKAVREYLRNWTELNSEDINRVIKDGGGIAEGMNNTIIDGLREHVKKQGTSSFSRVLTAIEESGIRQLRFGELPMQDILRSAGTIATRYYNYRYPREATGEFKSGHAPGTMGRLLGRLGPALGTAGQLVGTADVVGELAKSYYDRAMGSYRELTASGQLTGQGTMAGFEAKYLSPLKLFQPFGRIGWGTAQEIVQQTREQGFTGPMAGRVEQGLAHVISNLGIQVGQATEFFTQSMREGGMSVGQVTQEMNNFHDATRNLNMNINDYTQMIMTSTETLRDMGAGTAAPGLAQQITAALPRAYRTPEGMQFLTGAFQKSRGVLAAMVGHGANVLNITSQRYARAGWSAMDTLLRREVQRAKDQGYTTPNDIANYLSQTSPFFEGSNVNQLQEYISRMEHGRGIGAQMTLSRAENVLHQRIAAASSKVVRYGQLTEGDVKQKNLMPLYGYTDAAGHMHTVTSHIRGSQLIGYRNANTGQFHSVHAFTTTTGDYYTGPSWNRVLHSGPGDMGTFNIHKEEKAKEAFIQAARKSHFLTSSQIKELEAAKPFEVNSTLQRIMQAQQGKKIDVGTQVGTITVELGKQAQGLLTLVKERQHAVANGSIQSNHTNK